MSELVETYEPSKYSILHNINYSSICLQNKTNYKFMLSRLRSPMGLFHLRMLKYKLSRMYEKPFNPETFQRLVRPHCKTSGGSNGHVWKYGLSLRGADSLASVVIVYYPVIKNKFTSDGKGRFEVSCPNRRDDVLLVINTDSAKQLLTKIIKHNFLTPCK